METSLVDEAIEPPSVTDTQLARLRPERNTPEYHYDAAAARAFAPGEPADHHAMLSEAIAYLTPDGNSVLNLQKVAAARMIVEQYRNSEHAKRG